MIVVEALDPALRRLVPTIKKTARKIAVLLKKEKAYVEIYLVRNFFARKKNGKEKKEFNVLSFPANQHFPRPDLSGIKRKNYFGEIYLNPEYIQKKGESLVFMLVHGFLHLFRYDHEKKDDRIRMEKKERQLMKFLTANDDK